ncbi:hypothetical protein [Parafrankia sp. FMc2]|uniref:hypothetical protein n=1 Tax=Parafrankia sp. FMc2 TaxID=3233196 RepID=UPI0034D6BD4B
MVDRHVMNGPVPADGLCGCGCGRTCPAAPAGGGRVPRYASRGCQQRAYRARQAARATPPADPASVAGLLDAIRDLAGVLDAGGQPDDALLAVVRDGTTVLLARAIPAPAAPTPDADRLAALPPAAPSPGTSPNPRPSRDDRSERTGPAPAATVPALPDDRHVATAPAVPVAGPEEVAPRPAGSRRRRERPVVLRTDRGDRPLSPELSAAVRAVVNASEGDTPVVRRVDSDVSGTQDVHVGGVLLGTVRPAYGPHGGKAWQARDVAGSVARAWRKGRMCETHPRRGDAVDALVYHLAFLAERARRASLRPRAVASTDTAPTIAT